MGQWHNRTYTLHCFVRGLLVFPASEMERNQMLIVDMDQIRVRVTIWGK